MLDKLDEVEYQMLPLINPFLTINLSKRRNSNTDEPNKELLSLWQQR